MAYVLEAHDSAGVVRRAVQAFGLLPQVRWAEIDSPLSSGVDVLTVDLTDEGTQRLTVALYDSSDASARAEVEALLTVVGSVFRRAVETERLTAEARTDPLTGLWNRRGLEELMDQALSRSARTGERVALLVCDVDNFKAINDRLGHEAGDAALVAAAGCIRSVTRPSDAAARLGGDEVALLLSGCDASGAMAVADRLREAIRRATPADSRVTLSIGIADVRMIHAPGPNRTSRESLLRLADEALYMAKHAGRDCAMIHPGAAVLPMRPPPMTASGEIQVDDVFDIDLDDLVLEDLALDPDLHASLQLRAG